MSCLDPSALLDLLEGRLTADDEQAAKQHIDGCEACREVFVATARSMQRAHTPESTRLPRGKSLGRYLVVSVLGAGGMGVVYDAIDTELDRRVALKVLRPEADEASERRLVREARAMARIAHPNVVAIFDVGEVDGQAFVAMERVHGVTLTRWLKKVDPPIDAIIETFIAAGRGIAAAHAAGLVHGDFKPDNVMLAKDGRTRVTDFGLARLIATEQSHRAGTPRYLAPEIWRGSVPDVKTDQFAFAVALWEALYKSLPYEGETVGELARSVCAGRLAQPVGSKVPSGFRKVLEQALKIDPAERFASMDELLAALSVRKRRRTPIVLGAVAVAAMAIGAVAFVALRSGTTHAAACEGEREKLTGIWDDGEKAAIRDRFGQAAWSRIEPRMSAWAAGWSKAWGEACSASKEDSPALRTACLERQRLEFAALSHAFREADADAVERAARAVEELPPRAACEDVAALRAIPPPPADLAARVAAVRADLTTARALGALGKLGPAEKKAELAARLAKSLDYLPVEAEAMHLRGRIAAQSGDLAGAERLIREAAETAQASFHHEEAAGAWIDLLSFIGAAKERNDDGRRWSRYAAASIAHLSGRDDLEARRLEAEGTEESLDRAAALYRKDAAAHPVALARTMDRLARLNAAPK
jgi:predicted Ser/Thr protein kinase